MFSGYENDTVEGSQHMRQLAFLPLFKHDDCM